MGHVCRVCEETLLAGRGCIDYSTAVADIDDIELQCTTIETDLHDSFNAFCFKCRRITMSVPVDATVNGQVCYLRSQVDHFKKLESYGLVVKEPHDDE
jgi:hypothetical protein